MAEPEPVAQCAGRWSSQDAPGKRSTWHECQRPIKTIIAGLPLCEGHKKQLLAWHERLGTKERVAERAAEQKTARAAARVQADERAWAERREQHARAVSLEASGPNIVYYIRRESDGLIKIGTSGNFRRRLPQLRAEHGALRILATHRGGREREQDTHKRFAGQHVIGEWFRPEEPLLSWIVEVRQSRKNRQTVLPGTVPIAEVEALRDELSEAA